MIHPAPRIMNAPIPKRVKSLRSGRVPGAAAMAILQLHGQNNNQDPTFRNY